MESSHSFCRTKSEEKMQNAVKTSAMYLIYTLPVAHGHVLRNFAQYTSLPPFPSGLSVNRESNK
jgi:hypothetical protein